MTSTSGIQRPLPVWTYQFWLLESQYPVACYIWSDCSILDQHLQWYFLNKPSIEMRYDFGHEIIVYFLRGFRQNFHALFELSIVRKFWWSSTCRKLGWSKLDWPKIQRIEDSFLQTHPNKEYYKFDELLWFLFVSNKMDQAMNHSLWYTKKQRKTILSSNIGRQTFQRSLR